MQAREPFFGRIDRAEDERFLIIFAWREGTQGDHQVVEVKHRSARVDAEYAARWCFGPSFGRTGEDDVARLWVAEDVLNAVEASQVLHGIINRLAVGQALLDDPLEASERNFAKLAGLCNVVIKSRKCFLDTLPG